VTATTSGKSTEPLAIRDFLESAPSGVDKLVETNESFVALPIKGGCEQEPAAAARN
jgi:hypothetical protein